jgi:putative phosphoesterase
MKLLIASDLHGSAYWCRKLMDAWDREQPERVLLLGDLLYHGPRNALPEEYNPAETARMLNERKREILCVQGNCDADVDQMVLEFPIMAAYAYIAEGKTRIFATHGHVFHTGNVPPLQAGDILLHGHTYVPAWEDHGGWMYLNPGSVSIPKGESRRGYMTLENGVFLWKTLEGETYHTEK